MELREYQRTIVERAKSILTSNRFVYLAMEVRTGKTLTSLSIAEEMGAKSVLFLTKKKALGSIGEDANKLCPSFEFFAINYESMHKLPKINWDLIILDEAHTLGAFPKPSKRAKAVRNLVRNRYVILLSGTPTPRS
jgi:superfamily II DNA or RNA helicase